MTDDRMPAERFPPGEFIKEELEARGWTQGDLAEITGIDLAGLNLIVNGKRSITPETAATIGEAFGTGAQFWLNLESSYRLWQRQPSAAGVARKARIYSMVPMREMLKRGWIEPSENIDVLEKRVCDFLWTKSVDESPRFYKHAAKKSGPYSEPPTIAQCAWLYRVRQIASEMVVPKYSADTLRRKIDTLHALTIAPEESRHVPRLLSECGICFVIVESLPGTKIDGVCFWLRDGATPVIGMSLRHDRIDNFWFVLRHELEHVLRGHGRDAPMLDVELEGERAGTDDPGLPKEERQANAAASEFCVPKAQMSSWMARKSPFFSEADLIGFAHTQKIHPGIAAGQLRFRTGRYNLFTKHLAKVRAAIAPSAVVDGWGEVAPVSG